MAGNFVEQIRQALYASKIISYTQGYMLMRAAAEEYGWHLNYGPHLRRCGAAAASSGAVSSATLSMRSTRTRISRICCSTRFSRRRSSSVREGVARGRGHGGDEGVPCSGTSVRRWHFTMASAVNAYQPTSCRLSATISAHTRTSVWTNRAANSFTPTGPAAAAKSRRAATT